MTSPLRVVAAALLLGALAGVVSAAGPAAAVLVLSAGFAAALAIRSRPRAACTVAASAAACAFALLRGAAAAESVASVEPREVTAIAATITRAGDVDRSPRGAEDEFAREATFGVETDDARCKIDVRVRFREGDALPPLLPGDRVRLVGAVVSHQRMSRFSNSDVLALRHHDCRGSLIEDRADVGVFDPSPSDADAVSERSSDDERRVA